MAKPIAITPTLTGKDAIKFLETLNDEKHKEENRIRIAGFLEKAREFSKTINDKTRK